MRAETFGPAANREGSDPLPCRRRALWRQQAEASLPPNAQAALEIDGGLSQPSVPPKAKPGRKPLDLTPEQRRARDAERKRDERARKAKR
jgi:hypothetical protein